MEHSLVLNYNINFVSDFGKERINIEIYLMQAMNCSTATQILPSHL